MRLRQLSSSDVFSFIPTLVAVAGDVFDGVLLCILLFPRDVFDHF